MEWNKHQIWLIQLSDYSQFYRLLWWCKWTQYFWQMSKCNVCQWELDLPPAVGRGLDCSAEHKSNRLVTAMKYQVLPPLPSTRDLWHYEVTAAINLSTSLTRLLPALSCPPASVSGLKQLCDRGGGRWGSCPLSSWLKQIGGRAICEMHGWNITLFSLGDKFQEASCHFYALRKKFHIQTFSKFAGEENVTMPESFIFTILIYYVICLKNRKN